jgi:hypothetical protein
MRGQLNTWRAERRASELAGKSAADRFEVGLKAYRKKIRPILVGFFAPFILGGAALALFLGGQWTFVGGLLVGFGIASFAWASEPPAYVEWWRQGYEGERRTARVLSRLGNGWQVLHDLPGEGGNRDHIVLGRAGLFLVDSKNLSGTASVAGDVLTISRFGIDAFDYAIPQGRWSRGAAARLHQELRQSFGSVPWVTPVVSLWSKFPDGRVESEGVGYVHGSHLAEWLLERPQILSDEEVAVWRVRLDRLITAEPAVESASSATSA